MDDLDLYLASRAHTEGRAQPRRSLRHVHLEEHPLAVAVVQLASEPFALWGALVGRARDNAQLIVAPEPRNMSISVLAMTDLANIVCEYVDECRDGSRETFTKKDGGQWDRCEEAPQLLVLNGAVVSLLDRIGRRMRTAGLSGLVEVPPIVNRAGAHLGYFAEVARRPGASSVIVLTEQLAHHWATGQSSFEDDHLGTQLAWHDPGLVEQVVPHALEGADPGKLSGAEAAARIEPTPMGVLSDPVDDRKTLVDQVMTFNRERDGATDRVTVEDLAGPVADSLRGTLEPMWRAIWTAYDWLAGLPAAPSVETRWSNDRYAFTRHADYIAGGGRMRSVDSVKRAALVLSDWEDAHTELSRAEVLEDPIALVGALASGEALAGMVTAVDADNYEPGEKGRALKRPLLTFKIDRECPLPIGTQMWWERRDGLKVEITETALHNDRTSTVTLKVVAGMNGELPMPGSSEIFTTLAPPRFYRSSLPEDVPWTHSPDEHAEEGVPLDEGPGLDEVLAPT